MNYVTLSDDELLVHLDKHSSDPLVQRLVTVLIEKRYGLVGDLLEFGMDEQTWTFTDNDEYNKYCPGQYIDHLRKDRDYYKEELKVAQFDLEQERKEIRDLKARTVAELIVELNQEITTANYVVREAETARNKAQDANKRTQDKMKVWSALSTDMSR